MQPISKNEMDYLIEKKIIILNKQGNYGDQLVVTGKFGSGRGKQRYVTPSTYNYLLKLQEKDKQELVDLDKVRPNQRYLFSDSVL
ncbi:MAG: hypothetical protein A2Y34_05505 [Spirochaetes bacterium GWC1_27_15]|nr:MAG: hypothetical protein A2Y34_05505 [Spirochaetes bacterium GWC1_27_15]